MERRKMKLASSMTTTQWHGQEPCYMVSLICCWSSVAAARRKGRKACLSLEDSKMLLLHSESSFIFALKHIEIMSVRRIIES